MALDELHARRLAVVASVFESALDRMEQALKTLERGDSTHSVRTEQIQKAKCKMVEIRRRLNEALEGFSVPLDKPDPRRVMAAEVATLWVILENARPERMKGYGRKLAPAESKIWEALIESLLEDLKDLRDASREGHAK
jgi:hypothetical protein